MSKQFFMKPTTGTGCAVFEIDGEKAVISATLGAASMLYKSEMTLEKGREQWKKLQERGFTRISEQEAKKAKFSHQYVWDMYR